jgi:3-oxoacyl-[acyl-carrier protein] reductase
MAGRLDGKVAVVTGAGGNLGQPTVKRLAADGAKIVIADRNADKARALAEQLPTESMIFNLDATNADSVDALVTAVAERFGQIDILAHTVGGFTMGKKIYEPGMADLEQMWRLNVVPVYLVGGRVARQMLDKEIAGKIVIIVSRAALKGGAAAGAYTASKAAALRLVESLAAEVQGKGINVNAISPSVIDTPPNRADMPDADFSKWVTPEHIADTIHFLASPAGDAYNGANLEIYGRA